MGSGRETLTIWNTLLFCCAALAGIYFHEPWRDEIQAWMIATEATSLSQLIENTRYEGHPLLWYILLFGLSQCTHDILFMQLLSVVIATATVFLCCKYAPFSKLQKTLFAFGFYPLFQYCLLSRSYGIVMLLTVAYLCLYCSQTHVSKIWIILFMMCNTSATGCVLAASLVASLLVKEWKEGKRLRMILKQHLFGFGIFIIGIILAAWQIYPEPDNNYSAVFSWQRMRSVFSALHDSYVYVAYWPRLLTWSSVHMRDLHLLDGLISLVVFVFFVRLFSQKFHLLFLYVFATICMVLFLTLSNMTSARFIGHFYLILVAALWLLFKEREYEITRVQGGVWLFILICQLVTGVVVYYSDMVKPFSNARATAEYIQKKQLEELTVTGAIDYTISPLGYWLHKPLYYMESRSYGTFITWNGKRSRMLSPEILLQETDSLTKEQGRAVVVITAALAAWGGQYDDFLKDTISSAGSDWILLQTFEGALVPDENYYVYLATSKHNRQ